MKLPKLYTILALVAFSFNALSTPLYAEPPYKTIVGGGAYSECKKAPHLATKVLFAGVLVGAIVAVAIKKPGNTHSHSHTHAH